MYNVQRWYADAQRLGLLPVLTHGSTFFHCPFQGSGRRRSGSHLPIQTCASPLEADTVRGGTRES